MLEKITIIGFALALLMGCVLGFVTIQVEEAEGAEGSPTPYITATAPLPTCHEETTVPCFTPEVPHSPYPAPFQTPVPDSYEGPSSNSSSSSAPAEPRDFQPSDAGLWSFIWDLFKTVFSDKD